MSSWPGSPMLRRVDRFWRARRANVATTFALSIVPIMFALGMTVDYGYAVKVRAKMNAAADAAALSTVTSSSMALTTAQVQASAKTLFNAQVAAIGRVSYDSTSYPVVTVQDVVQNNQRVRTATVSYQATAQNAFGNFLGRSTITIGGASTATASTSPNIDFYLMLDTSPSMAIPSTQAGINAMNAATPYQDGGVGCAFACHENYPSRESNGGTRRNPVFGNQGCPDDPRSRPGPCLDNYTIARNLGLTLRSDLVNQAVVNLVDTARNTAAATGAVYQLAGYTFDATTNVAFPLQLPTDATKTAAAANINMLVVDSENSNNGDQNTVFDDWGSTKGAFTVLRSAMGQAYNGAGAGSGTNNVGDHPQQILMIVTDGVADEPYNGTRIYNPAGGTTNLVTNLNTTCTSIKANTNVRIAVLYLVYNPLPLKNGSGGQTWYAGHVAPLQNNISPTLQNCASPGLFFQVNTGGDVSSAMNTLFQAAVRTARLSN